MSSCRCLASVSRGFGGESPNADALEETAAVLKDLNDKAHSTYDISSAPLDTGWWDDESYRGELREDPADE